MGKKKLFALALISCALTASAQETIEKPLPAQPEHRLEAQPEAVAMSTTDSLALPQLTERGTISRYTLWGPFGGWNDWSLHNGLNASLSLSATVGLGDNTGSGFAQSVALMYATELAPKALAGLRRLLLTLQLGPGPVQRRRPYGRAGLPLQRTLGSVSLRTEVDNDAEDAHATVLHGRLRRQDRG